MASFTRTGLDTTQEILNDGEFGFVADGGELVVDGADAVVGTGRNGLVVNGTLGAMTVTSLSDSAYQFVGSETEVLIGQSGFVLSIGGTALDLTSSFVARVVNNGSIVAQYQAIDFVQSDGAAGLLVTNNGSISGGTGIRSNSGTNLTVVNNTGVISTSGFVINTNGGSPTKINNSGTMTSGANLAMSLSSGDDVVINTGTIIGSISLQSGDDFFDGSDGVQASDSTINSGFGNDTILGGEGHEHVSGGFDSDEIRMGGGNDTIRGSRDEVDDLYDGEAGVDLVNYGASQDSVMVNLAIGLATGALVGVDTLVSIENVTTGTGNDTVFGSSDDNLIRTGDGADRALGDDGRDRIRGGEGNDTLFGGAGNDRLFGEADNDRLIGNDGNDALIGGLGRDAMTGGAGSDHFVFLDIADSGTTGGTRDAISDFEQGIDKIDLSGIDAVPGTAIDDAFAFIGTSAFSGTDGELRFRNTATLTIVEVDQDGDGTADLEIRLDGVIALIQGDFVL